MKNIFKKVGCILIAVLIAIGCVGCGDGNNGIDNSKTQLYISNFNGGVGTEWLYKVIDRFTEKYKDTSFEDGKTGVQIHVEKHKSATIKMELERNEIYFLENMNYYDLLTQGKLYDITEFVNEPLTEYDETESIAQKMDDAYVSYFKTSNDKYYGVPHYVSTYTLTYDRDLFNQKNLFIGLDGEVAYKSTEANSLSKGPDGLENTYDDGLPATYDEFFKLCAAMKTRGIDPFMWSGMHTWYTTYFLSSLKTDYEGSEAHIAYDFNGESTKLVDTINANGDITFKAPTEITSANGYEIYNSAGTYYALKFFEQVYNKGYYSSFALNEAISHVDAQGKFLLSRFEGGNTKPIGMLIEGNWWPHESTLTFQQMESRYGEETTLNNRNLAVMPFPKATVNEVGEKQTILDQSNSLCCVNANVSENKLKVVKAFFKFCHTDESLVEFVKTTNITRGFNFEISQTDYNGLNSFAKSVVDVIKNSNIVLPVSSAEIFYKNYSAFTPVNAFDTSYGRDPFDAYASGKSALDVFALSRNKYNQQNWSILIGD